MTSISAVSASLPLSLSLSLCPAFPLSELHHARTSQWLLARLLSHSRLRPSSHASPLPAPCSLSVSVPTNMRLHSTLVLLFLPAPHSSRKPPFWPHHGAHTSSTDDDGQRRGLAGLGWASSPPRLLTSVMAAAWARHDIKKCRCACRCVCCRGGLRTCARQRGSQWGEGGEQRARERARERHLVREELQPATAPGTWAGRVNLECCRQGIAATTLHTGCWLCGPAAGPPLGWRCAATGAPP